MLAALTRQQSIFCKHRQVNARRAAGSAKCAAIAVLALTGLAAVVAFRTHPGGFEGQGGWLLMLLTAVSGEISVGAFFVSWNHNGYMKAPSSGYGSKPLAMPSSFCGAQLPCRLSSGTTVNHAQMRWNIGH